MLDEQSDWFIGSFVSGVIALLARVITRTRPRATGD